MALLNPPELRPSLMILLIEYLDSRHGGKDSLDRLIATLAPESLSDDGKHQLDIEVTVSAADSIGLTTRDGDTVSATPEARAASKAGSRELVRFLRRLVLSPENNSADWGSQVRASDLTTSLAWFLCIPEESAPDAMESGPHSLTRLQHECFGSRSGGGETGISNWPIVNDTRWVSFRRWACSLGFAWPDPGGRILPDPTPAIRDELPFVLSGSGEMTASGFLDAVARELPVLDRGIYRDHVVENMVAERNRSDRLTDSMSTAIRRLEREGSLRLEDLDDADRVELFDGSTISHVRKGGTK
jgi:hypothetical protein